MLPLTDITFLSSFLFVFAVIYGLLATAKIMTEKNVNIIIALVFAFFTAMFEPFTAILQAFIPIVGIIFFIFFILIFVKKIISTDNKKDSLPVLASLVIVLIILGVLWEDVGNYFYKFGLEPANVLWIIGILLVLIIFYAVYSHSSDGK